MDRPAYQDPLCLLDATTVDMDQDTCRYRYQSNEAVVNRDRAVSKSSAGVGRGDTNSDLAVGVRHSPKHRWVFIPDMRPDQVWLFKQFDTRGGKDGIATCTFHDSFHDPRHDDQPKSSHGRRSIEFRFFLTYPKIGATSVKL